MGLWVGERLRVGPPHSVCVSLLKERYSVGASQPVVAGLSPPPSTTPVRRATPPSSFARAWRPVQSPTTLPPPPASPICATYSVSLNCRRRLPVCRRPSFPCP